MGDLLFYKLLLPRLLGLVLLVLQRLSIWLLLVVAEEEEVLEVVVEQEVFALVQD
jgi:sensor domain CHASE-containing protein